MTGPGCTTYEVIGTTSLHNANTHPKLPNYIGNAFDNWIAAKGYDPNCFCFGFAKVGFNIFTNITTFEVYACPTNAVGCGCTCTPSSANKGQLVDGNNKGDGFIDITDSNPAGSNSTGSTGKPTWKDGDCVYYTLVTRACPNCPPTTTTYHHTVTAIASGGPPSKPYFLYRLVYLKIFLLTPHYTNVILLMDAIPVINISLTYPPLNVTVPTQKIIVVLGLNGIMLYQMDQTLERAQ